MNTLKAVFPVLLFLTSISVFASGKAQYAVGSKLELPVLEDQFEKKHSLLANTQWIVFAHDMDSSRVIRDAFENQSTKSLAEANIQYYADISAMPGLISRFVAIPKMKKQTYSIILGRDEEELAMLPREPDRAVLIKIAEGKIVEVKTTDDIEVIKQSVFK